MQVRYIDRASPTVGQFTKDLGDIGNFIVSQVAEDFAEYVRRNKLSGQVLGVRTGETRSSTRFYKAQQGVFGVRPGVGIRGALNYLVGFERRGLAFMRPARREYAASGRHQEIGDDIMSAIIADRGLDR